MMKRVSVALIALFCLSSCYPYIHGAVKSNNLERVKAYVAKGHVNDREEIYQHTPLIMASYYGYTDIAEYLCQNGADPNAQGIDGSTALINAAYYNYLEIAKILLGAGASANQTDKKGHTALYYAELFHHQDVAEMLVQAGAVSR